MTIYRNVSYFFVLGLSVGSTDRMSILNRKPAQLKLHGVELRNLSASLNSTKNFFDEFFKFGANEVQYS